jgi:hypothetical protein
MWMRMSGHIVRSVWRGILRSTANDSSRGKKPEKCSSLTCVVNIACFVLQLSPYELV